DDRWAPRRTAAARVPGSRAGAGTRAVRHGRTVPGHRCEEPAGDRRGAAPAAGAGADRGDRPSRPGHRARHLRPRDPAEPAGGLLGTGPGGLHPRAHPRRLRRDRRGRCLPGEHLMTLLDFLMDHTYRMVFLGTSVIGLVAGALGSFAYLRKQSLISDVVSHSALLGTLLAFLAAVAIGADGRAMIGLILGAVMVGTAAALLANLVARLSKHRNDAGRAVTLTTCFGAGRVLLRVISAGAFPGKGGIPDSLFGRTGSPGSRPCPGTR